MSKNITRTGYLNYVIGFALFSLLLAFLIGNRHRDTGTFNWMTPLWADQAGYYVYLPALFVYDFDSNAFPENIEEKTGGGFALDAETGKVITRYSCGVAIMQAPFFIATHLLAGVLGQPQDGFSGIYHQVPNFAAWFYCLLGMIFLWRFLRLYFNRKIALFTLISLFFGTNLYYYAVDSTGMSHIYSFALFAVAAWLSKQVFSGKKPPRSYFILWSLVAALIVLTRPTNILLFPFLICMDCSSFHDLWGRVKKILVPENILILIISSFIVFLPQFLYWKYVSGSYIFYSYEGYGFSNWKSPKILELWFSPNNGLFLYSPLYLVLIWGMISMIKRKKTNGWIALVTFLVLTYVLASWFVFSFGCGYGSRNFVEYTVLLALPMGFLLKKAISGSIPKKLFVFALTAFLVFFNLKLTYAYNRCFQGGVWDFQEYASYLIELRRYHQPLDLKSPDYLNEGKEYSETIYLPASRAAHVKFNKAVVRAELALETEKPEALMVLAIDTPDSTLYWGSVLLREQISSKKLNRKQKVKCQFNLPVPLPVNATIAAYIWNLKKESFIMYDLDLYLTE